MSNNESIFSSLKIYDAEKAFVNAIRKGMNNPFNYMYMHSGVFKDYFKHSETRHYVSYFNLRNFFRYIKEKCGG